MSCNKMYRAICEIYTDHYGDCSTHTCLLDLLGEEDMLRRCVNLGLDKEYSDIYNEITEGGEKSEQES